MAIPSLVKRGLTIVTVAPTILFLIYSNPLWLAFLVWGLTFLAMLEWTALKRHLMVTLLWPSSTVNKLTSLNSPGATPPEKRRGMQTTTDEDDHVEVEYAAPVAKTNAFIVCKSLASSLVAIGAAIGPATFHLGMAVYFTCWVFFTLLGRNRAETTAVAAKKKIDGRASSATAADKVTRGAMLPAGSADTAACFQRIELQVIADHFATQLFLSFCLEYFGLVWVSGLSYSILLAIHGGDHGVLLMVTVLVSNWANDIAALIVGKLWRAVLRFPTHPLYPKLSPNKSVEGAVAGVLANGATATALLTGLGPQTWSDHGLVFFVVGVLFGILGVMGDLLESLFKRTARLKDTGGFFPGHGGVLDRIDGLVVVFPAAYWMVWLAAGTLQP